MGGIFEMKAIKLFSSAGIDEYYLDELGINVVAANEFDKKRSHIYEWLYPKSNMIVGDFRDSHIKKELIQIASSNEVELLIATPPCQGMSIAGKNKSNEEMLTDERNFLVFEVIELMKMYSFKYILIENVPRFLKIKYKFTGKDMEIKEMTLIEILNELFNKEYIVESAILDSADYGVPQHRKRAIIKVYKKGSTWLDPIKEKHVTVRDAIYHLPSLCPGEHSSIQYHYSRKHSKEHVLWMSHTPTGRSAFSNPEYYPRKSDGQKITGFGTCYKRIEWDRPCPTITIRSDAISSQNNVHPGRKLGNGLYSDPRVLTIKEIFILMSLPYDFALPHNLSDNEIRQIIGEAVPPLLTKKILEGITCPK
jgi:DNA (cytosine-5)-methyltransferase 1